MAAVKWSEQLTITIFLYLWKMSGGWIINGVGQLESLENPSFTELHSYDSSAGAY